MAALARRRRADGWRAPASTLRFGVEAGPGELDDADVVVLATGARPYVPAWAAAPPAADDDPFVVDRAGGPATLDAWTAIANPAAVAGPVLVADWGGGWDGLDAAEVLAEQGLEVTLACAAPVPGETLHQYQRNLYLARLDSAASPSCTTRRSWPAACATSSRAARPASRTCATIVYAAGPRARGRAVGGARGPAGRVRAGDVLGPRTAEEATLEGVTVFQRARAALDEGVEPEPVGDARRLGA